MEYCYGKITLDFGIDRTQNGQMASFWIYVII